MNDPRTHHFGKGWKWDVGMRCRDLESDGADYKGRVWNTPQEMFVLYLPVFTISRKWWTLNKANPVRGYRIKQSDFSSSSPYLPVRYMLSSEVRIPVQNQNIYMLLCNSYLRFRGTLTKHGDYVPATSKIIRNSVLHMINKISYEHNGVELDQAREVGITVMMKNSLSLTRN
ncbi:hypothetical protein PR048_023489 [Dryococelus australis]|uniref:Double jelly roll-like domain-containing protein n=1 Tax=Dryococelus australis TaxID=614101 RepID=A0ABQ9GU73_9NEOP|nr:hypothetical protein PR048_023489 [Dryococelus australis]